MAVSDLFFPILRVVGGGEYQDTALLQMLFCCVRTTLMVHVPGEIVPYDQMGRRALVLQPLRMWASSSLVAWLRNNYRTGGLFGLV